MYFQDTPSYITADGATTYQYPADSGPKYYLARLENILAIQNQIDKKY